MIAPIARVIPPEAIAISTPAATAAAPVATHPAIICAKLMADSIAAAASLII